MTAVSPTLLSPGGAEALAAELVAEMTIRWRGGERPLPEEFFARHPDLWDHPEAAADLIYEELCLREEFGPDVSVEQVLDRFPSWRPQLELLFDCQRLLGPRRPAPRFPIAGESLGDFLLLSELGRGINGRVFLASQLSLGERPIVLKLAPIAGAGVADAEEHLSLARLQHTNIVPLYSVQEHPGRGLRALVMPYFGGATLARLNVALRKSPPANRSGRDVLDALERSRSAEPTIAPARQAARPTFVGASFAQTVCWIGAGLADALQYAHDRGLVHLDLKPSNVLLTADGQPMVLDFHLARPPISPAIAGPAWLGGTPGYMSPEQMAALLAVRQGKSVSLPVDARSDVFSLGVVLFEMLAGCLPWPDNDLHAMTTMRASKLQSAGGEPPRARCNVPLHVRNAQVSIGLSDIIHKCLAEDSTQRYSTMASLAIDLRRHLADLPLAGVRNRNFGERWHKWRRRRPYGVAITGMLGAVFAAACAVAVGAVTHVNDRIDQGRAALAEGRVATAKGEWDAAAATLRRGLAAIQNLPWQSDLVEELERCLQTAGAGRAAADRANAIAELHRLADRARFVYGADRPSTAGMSDLAAGCSAFWNDRSRVLKRLRPTSSAGLEPVVRTDLLELAICWANAADIAPSENDDVPLAGARARTEVHSAALVILDQAESLVGPSPVLDLERRLHGAPGVSRPPATARTSAWEHYAMGRALLRLGDLDCGAAEVDRALRMEPQGMWPNYYQGVCAYRGGHFVDAVASFGVCIGAAPDAAGCYYNRALSFAAMSRKAAALRDYEQAQRLDSTLTSPVLDGLRQPREHEGRNQ